MTVWNKDQSQKRRVVVTGIGLVTPIGINVEDFWDNLIRGCSGVTPITLFDPAGLPSKIGAQVKEWKAADHMPVKLARETDRFAQFAIAAGKAAMEDSGLDAGWLDNYRTGVGIGNAMGGVITTTEQQERLCRNISSRVSPYFLTKSLPNMAAGQLSIMYGFNGPCLTVNAACASGADAIGLSSLYIRYGRADVMLAGGAESLYCRLVMASLSAARALSTRNDRPDQASRPFDGLRDGMVFGEGAGMLVLEEAGRAVRRGARVYGEILGYGSCGDAHHVTAPDPTGKGEVYCIRQALNDAGVNREQVDYINAHGTSTIIGDKVETLAVKEVFGSRACEIPISSIKGATGHMMGAAGAVELITCLKTVETGIVPPTLNQEVKDPDCDLDYVPNTAREKKVNIALSNSFGFGGQNAALVVSRFLP